MTEVVSNQKLPELVAKHKTPFYVYNKHILSETVAELKKAFSVSNFQLLFATMANDNEEFLKTIRADDVGACLNSMKHLKIALDCGFSNENIQYTSTGIEPEDLRKLSDEEITVNFDSLNQLKQWFDIKKENKAGIRINTSSLSKNISVADRLGIEKENLPEALKIAESTGGIINGLHIYVGTNYKSHLEMLPALIPFFNLAKEVSDLEYVNIGGGIGVNYIGQEDDFNIHEYGRKVSDLLDELRKFHRREIKLFFEPGRRLAAPCGVLVTKVTDIKYLNDTKYIVVDASVAVFPRPLHHPESPHNIMLPFNKNGVGTEETTVVGKTTFSKDILSRTHLPQNLSVGDVLLFEQSGAYCDSMRSKFLGQNDPPNIFINN